MTSITSFELLIGTPLVIALLGGVGALGYHLGRIHELNKAIRDERAGKGKP